MEGIAIQAQMSTGTALATVVELRGSGYRRPGARMLAAGSRRLAGCISGGCLEADALLHAAGVAIEGRPRLVTYDTTDPADALLGAGLGCEGVLRVLIEPAAAPGVRAFVAAWGAALAGGRPVVQALVVEAARVDALAGERIVWTGGQELYADVNDPQLAAALRRTFAAGGPAPGPGRLARLAVGRGAVSVYWEAIAPPLALWICGAGLDAPAMAEGARTLGLRVTVFDHRAAYARAERFPGARVVCARPDELAGEPRPDAAILMAHGYEADRAWLGALLAAPPRYVGLLGPRRRAEAMLRELAVACFPDWLHAPLGLDLGAETPEEVALAALGELKAVLAGRSAGFLRDRAGPIHAHVPAAGALPAHQGPGDGAFGALPTSLAPAEAPCPRPAA